MLPTTCLLSAGTSADQSPSNVTGDRPVVVGRQARSRLAPELSFASARRAALKIDLPPWSTVSDAVTSWTVVLAGTASGANAGCVGAATPP